MFSSDDLNSLTRSIMDSLHGKGACNNKVQKPGNNSGANGNNGNNGSNGSNGNGSSNGKKKLALTPSQALVIGGILGGVLDIESVLVDRDQTVQIVLSGSLKQKTELEKMLDQIGSMPFDEVVKAMLGRL